MNQDEQKTAKIIASTTLNETQVKQALMDFVSKDEKLVEALEGQQAVLWVKWHVNKWDDPNSFCTLAFGTVDENAENTEDTPNED